MSSEIALISSGYDNVIRFWSDFQNDSESKFDVAIKDSKDSKAGAVNALEMSPNKEYVAYAEGTAVKFLDLKTLSPNNPTPVVTVNSHEGIVSCILIPQNFNNCFLSAGEDSSIRLNDIRTQKCVKTFYHSNYVNCIALVNSNKEIIAGDENGSLKLWDISRGEVRSEYNSNANEPGLAFRSISVNEQEGFLVAAKSSGMCYVFDYNNKEKSQNLDMLNSWEAHKTYITKALFSPEKDMLATCSADNEIRLWKRKEIISSLPQSSVSKEFELRTKFIGHKKWVWDCDFSSDSEYLISCSSDTTIKIWKIETGKTISTLKNPKGVNNIVLADNEEEYS